MSQGVVNFAPNLSTSRPVTTADGDHETLFVFPTAWMVTAIVESILISASLWIAGSFIMDGIRGGKWTQKIKKIEKDMAVLYSAAVVSAFLSIPRYALILAYMAISVSFANRKFANTDRLCEVLFDLGIGAYFIAVLPPYFFLWYRQRSLYQTSAFKHMYTMSVKILCWGSMMLLLLAGIASVCLFVIPVNRAMTADGCRIKHAERNKPAMSVAVGTTICVQLTLFGLFCHPIRKHRNATKYLRSTPAKVKTVEERKADQTMQIMIRLSKSMGMCVVSDLGAILFGALSKPNLRVLVTSATMYDLSSFLNLASLTYSFTSWKLILCAPCTSRREDPGERKRVQFQLDTVSRKKRQPFRALMEATIDLELGAKAI